MVMTEQQEVIDKLNSYQETVKEKVLRMASGWVTVVLILIGLYFLTDKHLQLFHDREIQLINQLIVELNYYKSQ